MNNITLSHLIHTYNLLKLPNISEANTYSLWFSFNYDYSDVYCTVCGVDIEW